MDTGLRIATYNVLAQCFVEPDRYAPVCPLALLEPARRQAAVVETVAGLDADILLLQEVEPVLLDALRDRLGGSHRLLYAQRPTHTDGCVIGVSRSLPVLGFETVVYRHHEPGYSQVAAVARIQVGDEALTVASTHLRCGCQTTCQEPLGLLQMRELLDHLRSEHRCILGGDLNATPDSPTLEAATAAGFALASAAPTACIRGVIGKRDYLLHAGVGLAASPVPGLDRLPSAAHPSDHVPLVAKLMV